MGSSELYCVWTTTQLIFDLNVASLSAAASDFLFNFSLRAMNCFDTFIAHIYFVLIKRNYKILLLRINLVGNVQVVGARDERVRTDEAVENPGARHSPKNKERAFSQNLQSPHIYIHK